MTLQTLTLTLVAVLMSAIGQISLKVAVNRPDLRAAIDEGIFPAALAAVSSFYVWAAFAIYVISIGLWLWVLTKVELSLAYPLLSLGFVVTMVFAGVFLHEQVTPFRVAGTLLIVAGCFCVGRSA